MKLIKTSKEDSLGVLYLISKANNYFKFRIKLQKLILISKLKFNYPFSFEYNSYFYGPYSETLSFLLLDLCKRSLIEEISEETIKNGEIVKVFKYRLTADGKIALEKLKSDRNDLIEKLDRVWFEYGQKNTEYIVAEAKRISGIDSIKIS